MKKALQLALTLALALAALAGTFHLTAEPAQALTCPSTKLVSGQVCSFTGVTDVGGAICCTYQCPNGSTAYGRCEQTP